MLDLSLHKTRRWKRSITSTDISPSEETCFSSSTSLSSSKTSEFCSICNKKNHVARYKCPRCHIPYCSKECYVLHNRGEKKNCSELFFKDRVMKMSQYEVKSPENVEGMHQILNRAAAAATNVNNYNNCYEQLDDAEEEECNHNKSLILNDEDEKIEKELMELAQLFNLTSNINNEDDETTNNNNNTITSDQTEELILFQAIQSNKFPNIQKMFETSVSNGNLSHLIKVWDPWWIPSPSIEDNSDQNTKKDKRKKKKRNKTLDEQLLSIPYLSSSSTSAIKPNPNLRYNMIDIVYSIVSCLRYYNGLSDSSNNKNETPYFLYHLEVSEYLLSISQVLSPEKNFTCYESITELLTSIHQGEGGRRRRTHDNTIPWYVLFQDLIYILENTRYLGKVLIIGQDILRKGIHDIKRYDEEEEKDMGGKEVEKQQQQLSLGVLRKAKKKIEFYLSWYKTHWRSQKDTNNNILKMCEEIQEYLDHWKR